MLESADDISSGSGGFTATPLSKRKSEQDDDSCLEDQHSVNKKLSQKKLKGEWAVSFWWVAVLYSVMALFLLHFLKLCLSIFVFGFV